MLTQNYLKSLLDYEPKTGEFTWRVSRGMAKAGLRAGRIHHSGYVGITINGKEYRAHRLAWLYVYGAFPENSMDHINGVKSDNRIVNLRNATDSENSQNKAVYKQNKSGFIGVSYIKSRGKYMAQIYVSGKRKYLGIFDTAELAFEAYKAEKQLLHSFNPAVPARSQQGKAVQP